MAKTKNHKFPDPSKDGLQDAVIFCPSEKVKALYNQNNTKQAANMSATVKKWFLENARENGWLNAKHVNAVQTKHSAGFILFNPGFSKLDNKGHIVVVIQKD